MARRKCKNASRGWFWWRYWFIKKNHNIVKNICSSVIIPVEFAGGIRSLEDAEAAFDLGVARISINTMALEHKDMFIKLFEKFGPSKVVLSLDIVDGELITRGRQKKRDWTI